MVEEVHLKKMERRPLSAQDRSYLIAAPLSPGYSTAFGSLYS